jgi:hypothetical protein
MKCVALLKSLPLVYPSLEEHQKQDPFCVDLRGKIQAGRVLLITSRCLEVFCVTIQKG